MGVYARYKKDGADGLRALVTLLETTPKDRRDRMIQVGMDEDPLYTEKALSFILTFEDILNLPDLELAEVVAKAPPRMMAFAIALLPEETQIRFLRNAQGPVLSEIRQYVEVKVGLREAGGAQLKVIATARELEKAGYVRTKKLPT